MFVSSMSLSCYPNGQRKLNTDGMFSVVGNALDVVERESFLDIVMSSTPHMADAWLRQELSGQIRCCDLESFIMNKPVDATIDDWCDKAIADCSWLEAHDAWQKGLDVFVALKSYFKFRLYSVKYLQSQRNSIQTLGLSILAKGVLAGYKMTDTPDYEIPRDACCSFVSDVLFEMHLCQESTQCNKPWCSHSLSPSKVRFE